jgi:hypothetical protein
MERVPNLGGTGTVNPAPRDELLGEVDKAIEQFVTAARALELAPDLSAAEEANLASCGAVQLFFFAREDYSDLEPSKIRDLVNALQTTKSTLSQLGQQLGHDSLPLAYYENVDRRQQLVDAVLRDDRRTIRTLLREGLEAPEGSCDPAKCAARP